MANFKYPLDLDGNTEEYKHYIRFKTLRERLTSNVPSFGDSCSLYIPPDALKTAYSQAYADADLGQAGNMVRNVTNVEKLAMAVQSPSADTVFNVLKQVGGSDPNNILTSIAGGLAKEAQGVVSAGATAAVTDRIGAVINNHKAVIYQGPGGFRVFNYNFSMIPESENEAKEIKNIVRFFKEAMHPEVGQFGYTAGSRPDGSDRTFGFISGQTNSSLLFAYPDEFSIEIIPNSTRGGRTNEKLFKIDKCFLENISVDYTTQGATTFFDTGDPVTTTISLQFKETTVMTRNKIREGY